MTTPDSGVPGGPGVPTGPGESGVPGSGGVPGAADGATSGGTPAPITAPAPAQPAGLTPGELAVLRKIATDSDFRVQFAADPIAAITGADLKVTTADYDRLEQLTEAQLDQVAEGVQTLVGAGAMASGLRAEGTNTLLYAVIVAILLAEAPPAARTVA